MLEEEAWKVGQLGFLRAALRQDFGLTQDPLMHTVGKHTAIGELSVFYISKLLKFSYKRSLI